MPKERTGSLRTRNGKIYARITWTDETGRRHEITRQVATRTKGRQILRTLLAKLSVEGVPTFDAARMTFSDLADFFEQHHAIPPVYVDGCKVAGLRAYKDVLKHVKVLRAHFHKIKLSKLTYRTLEQFRRSRLTLPVKCNGQQRTLASVHRTLTVLRTMLNVAVREGWLTRNPFNAGKPLIRSADERPRERVLTYDEEKRLLALCTGRRAHIRPFLIAALDTGCRRGELLTLKWTDIDFSACTLHIEAFNTKTQRGRMVETPRDCRRLQHLRG